MVSKVRPLPTKPGRPRKADGQSPLRPGVHITPSVRLVSPIGEGAMGSIWLADHLALKTQVAVKCVAGGVSSEDDEGLARFRLEASTAAQIKSPHITHVLDTGATDDGMPYIVMEYLEGETLGERLQRSGWLRLPQAARIVAHVGKALNSAHGVGVVHRDIKPDNIFLMRTDDGMFCKVLDFGIAKQTRVPSLRSLTQEGDVLGTLEFMSPEQMMQQGDLDFRVDLWALGVVTYCTITGRLPFSGASMGELCLNIIHRRFASPGSFRKDLPAGIDRWFDRAFHEDPTQRFESAKEMALAFVTVAEESGDTLSAGLRDTSEHPLSLPPLASSAPTAVTAQAQLTAATADARADAAEIEAPGLASEGTETQSASEQPAEDPAPLLARAEASPPPSSRARLAVFLGAAMLLVAAVAFGLGRLGSTSAADSETEPETAGVQGNTATSREPEPAAAEGTASADEAASSTPTAEPPPEPTGSAGSESTTTRGATTQHPPDRPPHGTVKQVPTPTAAPQPSPAFPVPDEPDF